MSDPKEPQPIADLFISAPVDVDTHLEVVVKKDAEPDKLREQFLTLLNSGLTPKEAMNRMKIEPGAQGLAARTMFQSFIEQTVHGFRVAPQVAAEFIRAADNKLMVQALVDNDIETYDKIATRRQKDPQLGMAEKKTGVKIDITVLKELMNEADSIDVTWEEVEETSQTNENKGDI